MEKTRKARIVTKNIINKDLFNELNRVLLDAVIMMDVKWSNEEHRKSYVGIIEDFLDDVASTGKIIQHKVVCDHRNNKSFMKQKEILFSVQYKQPHCFNWTTIDYYVRV